MWCRRCLNQCSHLGMFWGMDANSTEVDGTCECSSGQQVQSLETLHGLLTGSWTYTAQACCVWHPLGVSCSCSERCRGLDCPDDDQAAGLAVELQGADCSGQWMYAGDNSVNCYSNCSDARMCKSGWCHCEPGR